MLHAPQLAIVSKRVALDTREVTLGEAGRQQIFSQQKLVGAISIFNAGPDIVFCAELQGGFQQIRIPYIAVLQALISSPEDK